MACDAVSHRAAKMLHTLAPDLSELKPIGRNSMGEWLDCRYCGTTLLVEPLRTEAHNALAVAL